MHRIHSQITGQAKWFGLRRSAMLALLAGICSTFTEPFGTLWIASDLEAREGGPGQLFIFSLSEYLIFPA